MADLTGTQMISVAEAAAHTGVSARTIRRYVAEGRLTGYRVGPRLVKVDRNELKELVRVIPNTALGDPE